MSLFIGIDVGTSAIRACAVDRQARVVADSRCPLPAAEHDNGSVQQDAGIWWRFLIEALDRLFAEIDAGQVRRMAVDGTSATLLLSDRNGNPLSQGLMYNDRRATQAAEKIQRVAPENSAAQGASSSLAKLLYLQDHIRPADCLALHQADWLTGKLSGRFGFSDENNVLKLGYDVVNRRWPEWINRLGVEQAMLPNVVAPGTIIGTLQPSLALRWGCFGEVEIAAGTTDSTAGFIAAGAVQTGTAVTVLGSTLVVKILSPQPVYSAAHGVYSHRLNDRWLVGGASNAGGAVLHDFFDDSEIERLTSLLHPGTPTGLDYYPLSAPGERFPVNDPSLQPRLTPRPASDIEFFQGILEGLAQIESQGYRLLEQLGAPYPERVITVGGGACNAGWQAIRSQALGVPVERAHQQEAACGAALLALRGETLFPDS